MRKEELFRVLGEIDDELIGRAQNMEGIENNRKKKYRWKQYGIVAASIGVLIVVGTIYSTSYRPGVIDSKVANTSGDGANGDADEGVNQYEQGHEVNNQDSSNGQSGESTSGTIATDVSIDMSQEVGITQLKVQEIWPKDQAVAANIDFVLDEEDNLKMPVYRKYADFKGDKTTFNSGRSVGLEEPITDDLDDESNLSNSEIMKQHLVEIGEKIGVTVKIDDITDVKPTDDLEITINGKQLSPPIKDQLFEEEQYYWQDEDYILSISQLSKKSNNFQGQILLKTREKENAISEELLKQLRNNQAYETAKEVLEKHSKLLMLEVPMPSSEIRNEDNNWVVGCYNKGSTIQQELFNYSCEQTDIYIDESGNLVKIKFLILNRSNKVGDYKCSTKDQVKEMVQAGIFYNPSSADVNLVNYDKNVEIRYLPTIDTQYLMPYYKLEIVKDEENYYIFVPAIQQIFLTEYSTWAEQINK